MIRMFLTAKSPGPTARRREKSDTPLTVGVSVSAACVVPPAGTTVVVQYRVR